MFKKLLCLIVDVFLMISFSAIVCADVPEMRIFPVEACHVESPSPDTNYANRATMLVKEGSRSAFLKFDLSTLQTWLAQNKDYEIDSAKIAMTSVGDWKEGVDTTYDVIPALFHVDDAWSQTEVTYNRQPAIGAQLTDDSVTLPAGVKTYSFEMDITAAVKNELESDTLLSMSLQHVLLHTNTSRSYASLAYGKEEYRPQIIVSFKEKEYDNALASVAFYNGSSEEISAICAGNVTAVADIVSWDGSAVEATLFGALYKRNAAGAEQMVDLKASMPLRISAAGRQQGVCEFTVPDDGDYFIRLWVTDGIASQKVFSSELLFDADGARQSWGRQMSKFTFSNKKAEVNRQTGTITISADTGNVEKNFGILVLDSQTDVNDLTPENIAEHTVYAGVAQAKNGAVEKAFAAADDVYYQSYAAYIDNIDAEDGCAKLEFEYYLDGVEEEIFELLKDTETVDDFKDLLLTYHKFFGIILDENVDFSLVYPVTSDSVAAFSQTYNSIIAAQRLNAVTDETQAKEVFESLIDYIAMDEKLKSAWKNEDFPQYARDKFYARITKETFSIGSLAEAIEHGILNAAVAGAPKYGDLMKVMEEEALLGGYFSEAFAGSDYSKLSSKENFYKQLIYENLDGKDNINRAIYSAASKVYESEQKGSQGGSGSSSSGSSGRTDNVRVNAPDTPPLTPITPQEAETTESIYSDVSKESWMYESISALSAKEIISGYEDKTFQPNAFVTREEFTKMIVLATGKEDAQSSSNFADVDSLRWSHQYISAAVSAGLIKGIADELFAPGENITRQDAAVICFRAFEDVTASGTAKPFHDEASVSDYAKEAIRFLSSINVLNGDGSGNVRPGEFITRGEACALVYNMLTALDK